MNMCDHEHPPISTLYGSPGDHVSAPPTESTENPLIPKLSKRKLEVLRLVALGKRDREIGESLFISVRTVTTYICEILLDLGVTNRTQAAVYATVNGIIETPPLGSATQPVLGDDDMGSGSYTGVLPRRI